MKVSYDLERTLAHWDMAKRRAFKKAMRRAYDSVRKPLPPPNKVERPAKGAGYRRRPKHKKDPEII